MVRSRPSRNAFAARTPAPYSAREHAATHGPRQVPSSNRRHFGAAIFGEQFGLVRERQRHRLRAVAELEPVVQPPGRVLGAFRSTSGPYTPSSLPVGLFAMNTYGAGDLPMQM